MAAHSARQPWELGPDWSNRERYWGLFLWAVAGQRFFNGRHLPGYVWHRRRGARTSEIRACRELWGHVR